jgi:hypothetical protein
MFRVHNDAPPDLSATVRNPVMTFMPCRSRDGEYGIFLGGSVSYWLISFQASAYWD